MLHVSSIFYKALQIHSVIYNSSITKLLYMYHRSFIKYY